MVHFLRVVFILFFFSAAWSQSPNGQLQCTNAQVNYELNLYFAVKAKNGNRMIGSCLMLAIQKQIELDQIQGLKIHPELMTEEDLILRLAEELDRIKFGLKPGEKLGPAHIKGEVFERGLDPDGNPIQ